MPIVFRFSTPRICLVGFIISLPILMLFFAWRGLDLDSIVIGCIATIIADIVFIWVFTRLCTVKVSTEGISAQTALGMPVQMQWSEMTSARRVNILGLPYWIVRANSKPVMWILDMFSGDIGFSRVVRELAPEENPLRTVVEKKV